MNLFLSAGEPSGDLHGANLVRALHGLRPDLECVGFGGERMEEAGCRIKEDYPKDLVMEMEEVRSKLTRADGWTFVKRLADRWSSSL